MHRVLQRSGPPGRCIAALLACLLLLPLSADAQVVRLQGPENFRIEPNGALLGALEAGIELPLRDTRDTWVEAELEGWVWARSLQIVDRDGFDLVVSAEGGENIRVRPQGAELGRLDEGALLEELERIPGWILVRRRGWIWRASVEIDETVETPVETRPSAQSPPPDVPADQPEAGSDTSRGTSPGSSADDPAGVLPVRPFTIEPGTVVRRSPGGETLAVVEEPGRVAIVGSEGEWARVLIEGWVRLPEGTIVPPMAGASPTTSGPPVRAGSAASGLGIDDVVANPEAALGTAVEWELQFISLERAGPGRPEFAEGEAYLLMRPAGAGTGRFVYVVIPDASVPAAEDFVPLERL
ncbi:MAG TPA: hypothetical protein VJ925_09735, partial [Longimicrobiales bacterium]|nr:hypothetical protein [Longimicrobiales bacterium]